MEHILPPLNRRSEDVSEQGVPHDPPAWFDEVSSALVFAQHLVLSGNVHDLYPGPRGSANLFVTLEGALGHLLNARGVGALLRYDPVDGLQTCGACPPDIWASLEKAGLALGQQAETPAELAAMHAAVTGLKQGRVALLVDYASHLPGPGPRERNEFFIAIDRAARARASDEAPVNPTIWIVDHPADLPDWFVVRNDLLREVQLEFPNLEDRFLFGYHLAESLGWTGTLPPSEEDRLLQEFALDCDGETLVAMRSIAKIAEEEELGLAGILDAVRTYRTGARRNPWTSPVLRERIRRARSLLEARIKGQPHALEKTLDILARSIMGLSGAQSGAKRQRPRGVLFFVGPTGVGKTELAKGVTELLFGDETACHRFDMSEFMEETSVARLIGAPPGHPGHERGGELINAAHRRPFSVFLFDEIEKAHPRILDMFLQILDEGRLTDARGSVAHFSEALIVFTSNIGMVNGSRASNMGMNVLPSDTYPQMESKICRAVEDHFRIDLQRPELVNRIGQNVVVFDFLKPDSVALIFRAILGRVIDTVATEHGIRVDLSDAALDQLKVLCTHDFFDGGRGVANRIETHFINPLAREMFATGAATDLHITGIVEEDGQTRLVLGDQERPAAPSPPASARVQPHRVATLTRHAERPHFAEANDKTVPDTGPKS